MITVCVGMGLVLESLKNNDAPVGFVDHSGLFADPLAPPTDSGKPPLEFVAFRTEDAAKAALQSGEIQVYYIIAKDYPESRNVKRYFLKSPGENATRQFWDFLQINLMEDLPPAIARRATLLSNVTVRSVDGRRELPKFGPTFGIIMPLMISIALLMLLVFSSGYLMSAITDEKENRTMEVLLTSVSPTQLLGGKVVGIALISLTQALIWIVAAVGGIVVARAAGVAWFQDLSLDWTTVAAAIAIAIPTYFVAAALMMAAGATVTSAQEGQSMGAFFFMLHFLPPWLASFLVITSPQSLLAIVLSVLPFTALLTVSLRNVFTVVPFWQIAICVAVQSACAVAAIWFAGKALRIGLLRYGQRLSFREIWKAGSS
jgi:ABC-2 type transport system permease protein